MSLGCANYRSIWNDKAASLAKVKKLITEAAQQGVNILAFPELSLSGYESNEENTMHREFAETIPGPVTEEIAELTRRLDIYVVLGMPERDAADNDTCYISCPLIGPEGLIGTYRKLHLGEPPLFRRACVLPAAAGSRCRDPLWPHRDPDLRRFLGIPRTVPHPDAEGRAYHHQQHRQHDHAGQAVLHHLHDNGKGDREPGLCGQRQPGGEREYLVLLRLQYHRRAGLPALSHVYAQAGDKEEIISAGLSFTRLHEFRNALALEKIRRSDVIHDEFEQMKRNI